MLDALHERAVAIRGARFREATAVQEKPGRYGDRKRKDVLISQLRKGAWLRRSFTLSTLNFLSPFAFAATLS